MMKRFLPIVLVACGGGDDTMLVPEEQEVSAIQGACGADVDHDGDDTIDQVWTFATQGLRHSETLHEMDGTVVHEQVFELDHAGRLLEWRFLLGGEVTTQRLSWVYDTVGRRLRFEEETATGSLVETVTAWTDSGRPAQASTVAPAGNYDTAWSYDDVGRATLVVRTHPDGSERSRRTITYDDAARTRHVVQVGVGAMQSTATFNSGGRLTKLVADGSGGTVTVELAWAGDRLTSMTDSFPEGRIVTRYSYDCD